jgi:hypothetical protein
MPDDDSDWEGEGVPMTRLAYLRILVEGYRAIGAVIPTELRREHDELATAEAERLAKIAAKEAEERQERLDRLYGQEKSLESWWNMQRQYGRTEAAKKWVEKHGVEHWEITEIRESEEEINKARNLARARKNQGFGRGRPVF